VVLNGVAVESFVRDATQGSEVRARHGIPASAPVVGTVAVFRVQKRLDLWLDAAKQILARHPDTHFLIVGDGPHRVDIEPWAVERGLGGRVHLPGLQTEVRGYLAAMDVYMMSSDFEGLPVALLEAMAMQLPTAVTAVGGIPEVIANGESGFVVPPRRPDLLAEQANVLLADPGLRRAMGIAARARVEAGFGMRRMQRELEGIYAKVVTGDVARA
jgi:glycosyltransferase involved in cell wall biosynthesis